MRLGRKAASARALAFLTCALALAAAGADASPIGDATTLYRQKKYAEARAILEPLAAANPNDPEASYYLGMVFLRQDGPSGLENARLWLGKAMRLAPSNSGYMADYAGVCLLLADRDSSFSLALEGRDLMSRAIEADPSNIGACDGLMQFYAKAPWPLGNPTRALNLAAHIARLNPRRGAAAYLAIAAIFEKSGLKADALSAKQAAQSLAPQPTQ